MPSDVYESIDPIIADWAADHQLPVYNRYKEVDVRSVDIARPRRWLRRRPAFQIWIEPPDGNQCIAVHAWDRLAQSAEWSATAATLREALETALQWVRRRE